MRASQFTGVWIHECENDLDVVFNTIDNIVSISFNGRELKSYHYPNGILLTHADAHIAEANNMQVPTQQTA